MNNLEINIVNILLDDYYVTMLGDIEISTGKSPQELVKEFIIDKYCEINNIKETDEEKILNLVYEKYAEDEDEEDEIISEFIKEQE